MGEQKYPLYLFAGMLPWLLFSETVQRCAPSLLDQANLITKTVFPAEIVPVSVFLSTLVSHLLAVALMVTAAGVWINQISIFLVLLPLYMLTVGLFAVGVGWIAASLHVFLRDTAQVLNVILDFLVLGDADFHRRGEVSGGGKVPAVCQSALLRGAELPGDPTALHAAALRRPGDFGGVWNFGIRGGRAVLPLHEARIRRRALTAAPAGLAAGDVVGGGDLRVAGAHDALHRSGADSHNSCCDEDDERDQERILDQILAVFILPPRLQQLHSCLPPRLLQPIVEGRSRKLPLDTVPLRLLVGIVSYP